MKLLSYILVVLIVTFFTIGLVNATPTPDEIFSDKYNPEKRWEMYRYLLRTDLVDCKDEKSLYLNHLDSDLLMIPNFYRLEYSKFPAKLTDYYSVKGFTLRNEGKSNLFQPRRLVNPFTGQLTQEVDLHHIRSGDVTVFHDIFPNQVERNLGIIWNSQIDEEEVKWLRLIQDNGTLLTFCQSHPGDRSKLPDFDNYGPYNLKDLFPQSIYGVFFTWTIHGTGMFNTSWRELNDRRNAGPINEVCGPGIEINNDETVQKKSIFDILNKPTIQTSSLKPSERWLAVKEELLKQLTPEEQEPIVKNTTDKYFFNIDSVFQHVFPALISKNASISTNPLDVFDKEISIAKTPILVELPKNPYTKKPIKFTPLDKPIPGSITYLLDKTADGQQRAMLIVWNYRIDNDEMRWLLLFEKNGGLMNFCWDTQAKDWKISPDLFKTLFSSVNSVHFYTYPLQTTTPDAK